MFTNTILAWNRRAAAERARLLEYRKDGCFELFPLAPDEAFPHPKMFLNEFTKDVCPGCASDTCSRDCAQLMQTGCLWFGCYYCILGRIVQRLQIMPGEPLTAEISSCYTRICLMTCVADTFLLSGSFVRAVIRQGVASRYSIGNEDYHFACLYELVFPTCSLLQMIREMELHGESPGMVCCYPADNGGPSPASMLDSGGIEPPELRHPME